MSEPLNCPDALDFLKLGEQVSTTRETHDDGALGFQSKSALTLAVGRELEQTARGTPLRMLSQTVVVVTSRITSRKPT